MGVSMPESNPQTIPISSQIGETKPPMSDAAKRLRGLLASGGVALFLASIYEYLSLAGVVDSMGAARVVLIFAGLIGFCGVLVSELFWGKSTTRKVLVSAISAVVLVGVLWRLDAWTVHYRATHPVPTTSQAASQAQSSASSQESQSRQTQQQSRSTTPTASSQAKGPVSSTRKPPSTPTPSPSEPKPTIIEGDTFTNNRQGDIYVEGQVPIQARDNLMRGPLNSIVAGPKSTISGNTQIVAPFDPQSTKNMDKRDVLAKIQAFSNQGDALRNASDVESKREEEMEWSEKVKNFLSESWNQSHVNQWDNLHGDGTIRDEIAKKLLLLRSFASEIRTNP
jgi:hypothetical protein